MCNDHELFDLVLTEEEWKMIKTDSTSEYPTKRLEPWVWANVIDQAFHRQYRMRCAFVYQDSYVTLSADQLTYKIAVNGKCKNKKCSNIFRGTAVKTIEHPGVTMQVRTRDTRNDIHEKVKRPFNRKMRKEAAKEMITEGCAAYRRRKAREIMRPGDTEPSSVPSQDVARHVRKEGIDNMLGVKKLDGRDLIKTIEEMKASIEYLNFIHEVGSWPFYVFFSFPAQLHAYKEYCRVNKNTSSISVDATGSIVKKIQRTNGSESSHIFLYSIVVNFDKTTVAVEEMLSERHDTEFITFWLKRWLRRGAPIPKEAVCDYSRALLSGLCLALNNMTIKAYIMFCFSSILKGSMERPQTLIRVDVAHLIHLVCRWNCFKAANQRCIKDFYVRCVALMVECQTLSDFDQVFSLTCVVGLQSYEDAQLESSHAKTAHEAREKLESFIAVREVRVDLIETISNKGEDENETISDQPNLAILKPTFVWRSG